MRLEVHCSWLHVVVDTNSQQSPEPTKPLPYDTHSTTASDLTASEPRVPAEHDVRPFVPFGFRY